ncbi:MAG TPA: peptidylprolyl isomerase [Thermoanaerobaculia bacterium]|jgi:peptidyl-prolyl cis-trans isomerase B (cyclophilin B)
MCSFLACGAKSTDNAAYDTTGTDTAATAADATAGSTDTSASTDTSTTTAQPAAQQETGMSQYENKVAELHTTAGQIDIRFFPDVAPNHVKNFLELAQSGSYDNTKFHRIIPGFMIQGGDPNTVSGNPNTWGTGGSPNNVKAEFNTVSHKRGIVSMARSQHPDSASSQFFIVVADSTFLDRNYTVFGQVTKGMDVADKIVSAPKGANDRPVNPVAITKVVIRDAREDEKGPAPQ